MTAFTHLHLHTQYSLLDGAIRLQDLFPRLQEMGMNAVAITDHGNMFGAIDFYTRARKAGIKPIIGCEVYVAGPKGMYDRTSRTNYHLVLLARDEVGFRNLCRLVSKAYLDGFYYHPRIDKQLLGEHSEGLIGLSACMSGEVASHIRHGRMDEAIDSAKSLAKLFAPGHFFLEIQRNGYPEQQAINPGLVEISRKLELPLVATNDCHYLNAGDHRAHDILLCISTGKTIDDPRRMRHETDKLYLRGSDEMHELFADIPEAVENTARIVQMCNLELELGKVYLPRYQVPEGYDLDSFLEHQSRTGLEKRLKGKSPSEQEPYWNRLEHELEVIKKMGFSGYFLIVWDFIAHAKSKGIPVGPGRGSGAGSLVAYALGITAIDPLAYDLLFERFLNPERISMPDFDIDFCQDRRGEVIKYVAEKYGHDHVAQIITFNQLKPRLAIKDVGRVLGLPFAETDRISKLVPPGPKVTLDQALKEEPRLQEIQRQNPTYKELVEVARQLEGLNRNYGTHAAGIVIADRPIIEMVPVLKGEDGVLTTQFAKDEVELAGLVKFDFLGLKTLTVIDHALRLIRQGGKEIDLDSIPLDDPKVFELLVSGDTDGVFQVESDGFKALMKELRPDRFEDLIAAVALYRPGPLQSGMVEDYIRRKHGGRISYPHPKTEPALRSTYGVIIYQEQVMRIAVDLCGFTMGQADTLRKAMGKKKTDVMAKLKQQFIEGANSRSGMSEAEARELFEKIEKFAEYAFNKSHSTAYALISYQTAYLKAHYPVEFMAALLSSEMNNTEKLLRHINNARQMGIGVLPPDVNLSEKNFGVRDGQILFGLGAIKGLGDAAIDAIVEARKERSFSSIYDFCYRVDAAKLNKRILETLITSGAMDGLGPNRASLHAVMEKAWNAAQSLQKEKRSRQCSLLDRLGSAEACRPTEPPVQKIPEWPESEKLRREREALGFCLSGHPLDRYRRFLGKTTNCTSATLASNARREVCIAALVASLRERPLKNGKGRMAIVTAEDLEGTFEAVVYSREYAEYEQLLKSQQPLLFIGTVSFDGEDEQTTKLKVRQVKPLDQECQSTISQVHIKVPARRLDEQRLKSLHRILAGCRGSCRAFLHIDLGDVGSEVVLRLPVSVASSEQL
ncbi:MAG: DNA polymerase III subunit alpha, partial [Deltaproteobacteria bacterium]